MQIPCLGQGKGGSRAGKAGCLEWPRAVNFSLEHCRALQPAHSWQTEDLAFDVTLRNILAWGPPVGGEEGGFLPSLLCFGV